MNSLKYLICLLLLIFFSGNSLFADDKDTIRIDDTIVISGFGNNLDSLLNLYYVQMATQIEDVDSLLYMESDSLIPDFPDSVYIDRLGRLPVIMEMSYNRIVKNFITLCK